MIPASQNYRPTAPKLESKPVDEKALGQLLRLVAEGEQDQAEALMKKDPGLLLFGGTVTDLSGREFKQITPFQYALWAMDWRMWTMIQKYLPLEAQEKQFAELEFKSTSHGKHFSLQPLIEALQTYTDNAKQVWRYDKRAETHWQTVVGGEQRRLPAHAINEYCRDQKFDPCPQFTDTTLPRTRAVNRSGDDWFVAQYNGGLLGSKFAVYKNTHPGWLCQSRIVNVQEATVNLKALQSLWKTLTNQLGLLASDLKLLTLEAGQEEIIPSQSLSVDTASSELKKSMAPPTAPVTSVSQSPHVLMALKGRRKPGDEKALSQLLQLVADGEQDQAEELIKKDRSLLLSAGTMMDLSGREFKQITAFQYALWAMDWHMWKMIQQYLPEDQQREQFLDLETKGTVHGKYFSLKPLIGALQTFVDKADKDWHFDKRADNHWQKVVGGAQRLLPAHVLHEYGRRGRSFSPCPQFTEDKLPRDGLDTFYTVEVNDGFLGNSYAVVRGFSWGPALAWPTSREAYKEGVDKDLVALRALSKVRTKQLESLASQLKLSDSCLVM